MQTSLFDRNSLNLKPLSERKHDLDISVISPLRASEDLLLLQQFYPIATRIIKAKKNSSSVIFMMGGHVIRAGVQNYIIDLMKRGYVSCIAMNGAGIIHDYEFSYIGGTTENVARYIKEGQFGLWKETGGINDIINRYYKNGDTVGLGEAIGKAIYESDFLYKNTSILVRGYELSIPVTVHVGIGYDIIHEHPNFDGAATGAMSYVDFLKYARVVQGLEGGVVMNFGSSVMAPEVFLKALSMARNIAHQKGDFIRHFATLVCDLHDLPENIDREPPKDNAAYCFRPWKTMLVRTVADGGESFYIKARHSDTIPALWTAINELEKTYNLGY